MLCVLVCCVLNHRVLLRECRVWVLSVCPVCMVVFVCVQIEGTYEHVQAPVQQVALSLDLVFSCLLYLLFVVVVGCAVMCVL